MEQQIVISCFDKTGNMVKPWADAGFLCYCVDMQHKPGETRVGNLIFVGENVYDWLPPRNKKIAAAFFFTPCTDVAVSGARWLSGKGLGALRDAIGLFFWSARIAEWCECPYLIENPISTLATYWRKPNHTFTPWEYTSFDITDNYTKETCLWTGGAL